MAKRFTDTEIFRDPWFRRLSLKHKCLWLFLCDECDFAGVWKVDYDLASYVIGDNITAADLEFINNDKERARVVNDKLVLIVDFVDFQYGDKIKGSSNPFHRKISNRLAEIDTLSTGCRQGVNTLSDTLSDTPQDKDKEKEKVKEEDKRDSKGEKEPEPATDEAERVYQLYPTRDRNNNNRTVAKSINDMEKIKEILAQGKYPPCKSNKTTSARCSTYRRLVKRFQYVSR